MQIKIINAMIMKWNVSLKQEKSGINVSVWAWNVCINKSNNYKMK